MVRGEEQFQVHWIGLDLVLDLDEDLIIKIPKNYISWYKLLLYTIDLLLHRTICYVRR